MKFLRTILVLVISVFLLNSVSFSSQKTKMKMTDLAVENLIAGVNSENLGLKINSAYLLGEYQCEKAVIPLLKMLKSSDREEERIAAALALYKIEDARGIFAVKQAIRFDTSERVKKLCALFYNEYSKPHKDNYSGYALK